ncbi:MAG: peptidase M16 [Firmicutes bacterium HGW-Firmicutes-12]|jgi:predicted Zn-dependent peptidase|nr:MAG: peptidase M16 [Firmicutes bacterium HGW-Firmicutes-12]
MYKNDTNKIQLNNGIRIVTEKIPAVRSVAIGIWVGTGSRHEDQNNSGISHFIEHLMFKGTEKRTAADIAESLDSVGGQLNAFTTKEFTCYYAKILDEHLDLAIDVLTDMFFNSKFSDQAIEKERGVVEEEIRMYEDTPDDLIHDLFVKTVWPEHSLGKPILGSIESLEKISRKDVVNYMEKNYLPERIVIAVAGNIEHQDVQNKLKPIFENMNNINTPKKISPPDNTISNVTNIYRKTGQVQICLGTEGIANSDDRLYSLSIINNVMGGGLSSRLVQSIREERGLAYSVFSYHSAFSDTGLFTFYAGTSPKKYDEVIKLLMQEIKRIATQGVTEKELNRTKEQIKGNLYLGLESVSSRMSRLGRNEISLNKIIPPEEVATKISAVSQEEIFKTAQYLFGENKFSLSTIGPLRKPLNINKYME